jgi:trk system potassium uptake protein TrkH
MALVGAWSAIQVAIGVDSERPVLLAILYSVAIGLAVTAGLRRISPRTRAHFGRRQALLLVVVVWVGGSGLAGLPYLMWADLTREGAHPHVFQSVTNCYFEAMSGLTTTGASVLADIESLPRGLLLWRSMTHWLGGLGIVSLFVAVLAPMGVMGRMVYGVEASGPAPTGLTPTMKDTTRILWLVYAGFTALEIALLRAAGLTWFQATCESFGTIATGGFSVRNASIAAYDSRTVEGIVTVFMIIGGVNFALYYELVRRRPLKVWRNSEFRFYLALLLIGATVVTLSLLGTRIVTTGGEEAGPDNASAVRYAVFNLVSMHTDTGFATANFDAWPFLGTTAIVAGTFIGGCAGSTTGGIKVIRFLVLVRMLIAMIERQYRPSVVRPLRILGRTWETDDQISVIVVVLLFALALGGGTVVLMFAEHDAQMDMRTAFSGTLATLCTAGPGLGRVGPAANYAWLSDLSKMVMCFLMLIGRLEIIPVAVLALPAFWRRG